MNNKKINMIKDDKQWKIDYLFEKDVNYSFEIHFNDIITNMERFFQDYVNVISLDLSNFDLSNITTLYRMFQGCKKLKEIKGINKFNSSKAINMCVMFQECHELECLDLSNFDISNVIVMSAMFNKCQKLKEIKGINKFITNKVTNMKGIFQECHEIEYIDLPNFDTSNITDNSVFF